MIMIKRLFQTIMDNPWIQVLFAIFIIVTSAMDIFTDIAQLKKEHGSFIVGIFMLVKSLRESYLHIKERSIEIMAISVDIKTKKKFSEDKT
jgi:hypothetical protein